MLQDDRTFVPGTSTKTVTFKLTPGDLRRDFWNGQTCPFYYALKRAKVPVYQVGSENAPYWVDEAFQMHKVSPEIVEAFRILAETNHLHLRARRAGYFKGKTFTVSW